MVKTRSYKLLCPIARALDRIGDRWTLLILRDLHAGPARFTDLQRGLTGIAANLLTERLGKLVADGLVKKVDGGHSTSVYELTELGTHTSDIILDLALFGGRFKPDGDIVQPGNLRTIATTMGAAAKRIVSHEMNFRAAILVDGENMQLIARDGKAEMHYTTCPSPDLIFSTSYTDLLALSEGEIKLEDFARSHSQLEVLSPGKDIEFLTLMSGIIELLNG